MLKRLKYLLLFCFCLCLGISTVDAVTYSSGTCYYFNASTGAYSTSNTGHKDCMKKLDSSDAYCVQWKRAVTNRSYVKDTSWKVSNKGAILAGILIELTRQKYEDNNTKRYAMTAATLNTFYSRYMKNGYSYDFYSKNSDIKSLYDAAVKKYGEYKFTKKLPAVTWKNASGTKITSSTFNYTNGAYISDKITLTGLKNTYGGYGGTVTYTISAGSKGKICSKASGVESSCKTSVTLTNRSADYSFYVKATGVTSSDDIVVKVTGKNSNKYPSSSRYTSSSASQTLLVKDTYTVSRTISSSLVLSVPDLTNHKIVAYKVDENGDLLTGATLEIYKDDYSKSSNLLAKNNGTASKVSYTSPKVSTDDDDFFKHDYYLVEKSAPDGYVLNSKVNQFYIKDSGSSSTSSICYYNGGSDSDEAVVADASRCNFSDYQYRCKSSADNSIVETPASGSCSDLDTGTDSDSTDSGTDNNGTTGGENPDTTNPAPSEPKVTYSQVCYNVSTNTEITDATYCSDKDNYTKVEKKQGNLTVTQVNSKNVVKISKRDATGGDDEVVGAELKICTAASYKEKGNACDPAKTIEDVEMSWVSGSSAHEVYGIKNGEYYIVETIAPDGYIKASTATSFTIDSTGEVKVGTKVASDSLIIIKNQPNTVTFSKQDIATSKELPGAKISICMTYVDDNKNIQMSKNQYTDECVPVLLADGSAATWESTDKAKEIKGLPAGTYYLVEIAAPKGYSTAESILFTMKEDGTLLDKDGNLIGDKKIVMKDEAIKQVPTGMLSVYIVLGIVFAVVCVGVGTYYYTSKGVRKFHSEKNGKIRKRRIHKTR